MHKWKYMYILIVWCVYVCVFMYVLYVSIYGVWIYESCMYVYRYILLFFTEHRRHQIYYQDPSIYYCMYVQYVCMYVVYVCMYVCMYVCGDLIIFFMIKHFLSVFWIVGSDVGDKAANVRTLMNYNAACMYVCMYVCIYVCMCVCLSLVDLKKL